MTASDAPHAYHDPVQLEHICSYWATVTQPEVIGPLAEGLRMNVYVTAGEVSGPKLHGRLRPVGGDWLLFVVTESGSWMFAQPWNWMMAL